MDYVLAFDDTVVLGNPVQKWIVACLVMVLGVLLARMAKAVLRKYGPRLAQFTETQLDDALLEEAINPVGALLVVAAFGAVTFIVQVPDRTHAMLLDAAVIAGGFVLVRLFSAWVDAFFVHGVRKWRDDRQPHIDTAVIEVGRKLAKVLVVVLGVLAILQTVGVNVMSLITGLGIGGLAVALAAQETLGNVLGSLQILTDRPFVAGDFIRVDGMFGQVREIGLRSTKVLTPDGVKIIVPNKKIAEAAVENCSVHRGVSERFELGLTYDTSAARIEEAAELLRQIIGGHAHTDDDVQVQFASFGDFSLNLRVVYHHTQFDEIAATRSEINLAIKGAFDAAGFAFAFPTRTMHIAGENPGDPLRVASS
jgi:MscS family membrane protein